MFKEVTSSDTWAVRCEQQVPLIAQARRQKGGKVAGACQH